MEKAKKQYMGRAAINRRDANPAVFPNRFLPSLYIKNEEISQERKAGSRTPISRFPKRWVPKPDQPGNHGRMVEVADVKVAARNSVVGLLLETN